MIRAPRSRVGIVCGGILGLTLGIAGVVPGLLCGHLLDLSLSDVRARRVIRYYLDSGRTPVLPAGRRWWLHPMRFLSQTILARDWERLKLDSEGAEWLLVVTAGAGLGFKNNDVVQTLDNYCRTTFNVSERHSVRLISLMRSESMGYPAGIPLGRLFALTSGERIRSHERFLNSLLPSDSPDVRTIAEQQSSADEAWRSGQSSPLLWDHEASAALGLDRPATVEEVRSAFRRLARECHPDQSGAETEAFIRLRQAYDRLLSCYDARSAGPVFEADHTSPHSRAQSDTHY